MISFSTAYLSFISKISNKLFYFFVTIFFLSYSATDYALLILYFLLCSYMAEIYSLSIPKLFEVFFHKYTYRVFLSTVIFSFYITVFLFLFFCFLFFAGKNIFESSQYYSNYIFIFSFLVGGLVISIDDIVDRYSFLHFNHNKIYIFDIFKIVISIIIVCIFIYYFKAIEILNFLLAYSLFVICFSLIKFFIFLRKINLNFFQNIVNIKIIEFRKSSSLLLSILLISIFIIGQFSFSRLLILHVENLESFATFSFHYQLAEICSLFFLVMTQIVSPAIVHFLKLGNAYRFKIFRDKILLALLLFPPIIFFLINFIAKDVIAILNLQITHNLFLNIILSLSLYSTFFYLIFYQYILILKKEIFFLKTIIFGFVINLILSIIFLYYFSISGVAVANFLSNLFIFIILNHELSFFYLRKKTIYVIIIYFIRLLVIAVFFMFFPIRDIFESSLLNLIKDLTYFTVLFFITELFLKKKFRLLANYINLTTFLNKNVKRLKINI